MKKKVKGFTLVELVICIAIIAVLVSIAIPQYNKARLSAIVATHNSNVQSIKSAAIITQIEDDEQEINDANVQKNLEGGKYPDINKAIIDATGVSNWSVEPGDDGSIVVAPGLVTLNGTTIELVN